MQTKRLFHTMFRSVLVWVFILVGFLLVEYKLERLRKRGQMKNGILRLRSNVLLKCLYMDGEISEETVTETIYSMENFWAKYEDWQFIGMENDK